MLCFRCGVHVLCPSCDMYICKRCGADLDAYKQLEDIVSEKTEEQT